MLDFRIDPPLVVKDTPKPRPLGSLAEAAAFIADAMRLGRPPPWRDMYQRLRAVRSERKPSKSSAPCANCSTWKICSYRQSWVSYRLTRIDRLTDESSDRRRLPS